MSLRTAIIICVMTVGTLSACVDKKSKEVKVDAATVEKATIEMSKEASETEAEIKVAKKIVEDNLRKADSLQQVKDHGHAH